MIIQSVTMRWTKETRGEPYASVRSRHPIHFPLPQDAIQQRQKGKNNSYDPQDLLLWHQLSFVQTTQGIEQQHQQYEWLSMSDTGVETQCELPGVIWRRVDDRLIIHACYHHSFGKPVRTNGQSDLLDEKAFELLPLQYGQILFNGRHTVEDGSVYEQRVINIWNVANNSTSYVLKHVPEHQYKQLAALW